MGVCFISGVYGVGKSTIAHELASVLHIPSFACSELISHVNGEDYSVTKTVSNKEKNQDILASQVSQLLMTHSKMILTGHFCIVNKENSVDILPANIFDKLHLDRIILLDASSDKILENLKSRDCRNYPEDTIEAIRRQERTSAQETAARLSCPLIIHQMQYNGQDLESLLNALHDKNDAQNR